MAAALLTLAGCSNEELVQQVPNQFNTLTATIEQSPSDSRIVVNDNNTLAWSDGDAIRVFMKNPAINEPSYYDYVYSNGIFSPREEGEVVPGTTTNDDVLGVYSLGADDNGDYSDGSIDENNDKKLNSGFSQNTVIKDGAQNRIILPMWGKWNDGAIAFKHLAGVLRINLSDLPDGYDLLTITSDEAISGTAYVNDVTVDNAVMVMENYPGTGDHNIITVRFANATTRTLYVPLPVNESYGSIEVKVSKYDENLSEGLYKDPIILATYTDKEVKRGYIYTASPVTPQVTGTLPTDVSSAISSGSNQETFILASEVDATDPNAGSIAIPDNKEKTILDFQVTPKTLQDKPLKFESNTSSSSTDATQELDINMPSDAEDLYVDINTPTATTTLNGGTYAQVTALTANQTLIIGEGVTVKKLVLKGGNVELKGNVENIECEVATTITLGNDITLVNAMTFSKGDATIILNEKVIKSASGDVFIVTDGTLTIKGSGLVHASADNLGAASAVWAKESSKVIINGGTYKVGHDGASKADGKTNWRNDCIYARDNASIEINGGEFMYTGEINTENFESDGDRFLLNCRNADYQAGNCSITVKGGTFHKFNPGATSSENPVANYVAAGYSSVAGDNDTYVVKEGILNETALKSAIASDLQDIILGENITDLTSAITIPTGTTATINLNGYNITAPNTDVFIVEGTLTIKDENNYGIVTAGSFNPANGVCAVWAKGGTVIIDGGHYKVYADQAGKRNDCIYAGHNADNADTAGNITINGGKFEYVWPDNKNYAIDYNGDQFLLNCANSDDSTTKITVNGGRFKNHVPSFEDTGREGEVVLGTGKNVYNDKTLQITAHSKEASDTWYEVKASSGNEDYIPE